MAGRQTKDEMLMVLKDMGKDTLDLQYGTAGKS